MLVGLVGELVERILNVYLVTFVCFCFLGEMKGYLFVCDLKVGF